MPHGICVCGLNGSGKTTLAAALAQKLHYKHMDIEGYYFPPSDQPYATSRTREEVERLLTEDIRQHPRFVFSAVNGSMTEEINDQYRAVIYLEVPLDIRMKRIRQRAVEKFGSRVLVGGDMYEQEEKFFAFAEKRTPEKIEQWLQTVSCPVIRLDGTKPISDNIGIITEWLR